jgi:hypothetical protein
VFLGTDAACAENALSPSAMAPAKLAINALRDMEVFFFLVVRTGGCFGLWFRSNTSFSAHPLNVL